VLFVTPAPGATNGAGRRAHRVPGFIGGGGVRGQVGNDFAERGSVPGNRLPAHVRAAHQVVAQIDRAERIPEYVSTRFHTADAGRPGPVLLGLFPRTCCFPRAAVADAPHFRTPRRCAFSSRHEGARAACSRAPSGRSCWWAGGGWTRQSTECAARLGGRRRHSRSGAAFRCQDYFDNRHPNYAGDVGIGINPGSRSA